MTEKIIEQKIKILIEQCRDNSTLNNIIIENSTSDARSLGDLCSDFRFNIFNDDSRWNTHPDIMIDIIRGCTPDIVLRSSVSGQNRVIIEVKKDSCLGHDTHSSQVIRYFLHLLATSTKNIGDDMGRAILLAAPRQWFASTKTGADWNYFVRQYSDLAKEFNITLGEIVLQTT